MNRPRIDWPRYVPYLALHFACLGVFYVGCSWAAILLTLVTFFARVFGLTAFYHRYFSHRSFKTSRVVQFFGALLGNSAAQRGAIWWAAHHRWHHSHSDEPTDIHSPRQLGFAYSHMGWFMTQESYATRKSLVKDWLRFPELLLLERFNFLAPAILGLGTFLLGYYLNLRYPTLGTSGAQMFVWAFIVSTILLYHTTYCVNSVAHRYGSRRFATKDDSRNNWLVALITFGEGWHNNHHHYPASARQGFYWWEIDITYYILVVLSMFGIVWDLKPVPSRVLREGRQSLAGSVESRA